jgi:lipopolysaccharide transport system ATP-binding protein
MYVRLAFAVAAHLDPEILIVDEVLAVGDAQFQRKCLGKMQEITEGLGRTILFVSHNMASINQLCGRGILLRDGHVAFDGPAADAVQGYFKLLSPEELGAEDGLARATLPASENLDMRLLEVRVKDEEGHLLRTDVPHDGAMKVEIDYEVIRPIPDAYVTCCFTDLSGANAWWQYDAETPVFGQRKPGRYRARVDVPAGFLRAGTYHVRPSIAQLGQSAIDYHGALFHVTIDDRHSVLARKGVQWPSLVQAATQWSTEQIT